MSLPAATPASPAGRRLLALTNVGPPPRPANGSRHWRDLVQQRQQLGDIVAVSAGQRHRERDALAVGDDVVLTARPCAVDRAGSASGPLHAARTWEESITARDQSSWFFDRSLFSARSRVTPASPSTGPPSLTRRRGSKPRSTKRRGRWPGATGPSSSWPRRRGGQERHPRPARAATTGADRTGRGRPTGPGVSGRTATRLPRRSGGRRHAFRTPARDRGLCGTGSGRAAQAVSGRRPPSRRAARGRAPPAEHRRPQRWSHTAGSAGRKRGSGRRGASASR
ncbi:hypothetical protein SUDANB148_06594 [Streptomyces sp. SudanB148_2056]